jgi:plasmid stabilization system protein ParE
MRLAYHPAVRNDVNAILKFYEGISASLADEFWDELLRFIELIGDNPDRSHPAERGLRRVNLHRFPYHILFRRLPSTIRITAVRHNKRHPLVGVRRR